LNGNAHKVPLPTYPFQRQSFWPASNGPRQAQERISIGIDEAFRAVSWKREAQAPLSHTAVDMDNWLVFERHEPLIDTSMFDGALGRENVVKVREGTEYREISAGSFEIDPAREDHFHQLINALAQRGRSPDRILYEWSALEAEDDSADAYEKAVCCCHNAALFLVRSLWKQHPDKPVELIFLTSGIWNVMGGDLSSPLGTIATGPALSIPIEHPNIGTRCIDVPNLDPGCWPPALAINLRAAIKERPPHRSIALRGEHRWSMQSESIKLPKQNSSQSIIKSRGVCLITGGLGDLGLAVARHLAGVAQTNLILFGRTELPEKPLWDDTLQKEDSNPRIRKILKGLKDIENANGQVLVCRGDVAKIDDVARARHIGLRHFGRIDGIVHAAGLPGDGLIQIRDLQSARKVLDAKIAGLRNLQQVFGKERLDYLVLFSSTAALSGGIAQADYCAANAYLDAYAQRGKHGWVDRVISINWGMWRDIGMGANTFVPAGKLRDLRERNLLSALTTEEALDAMMRALASEYRQVAVSKRGGNAMRPVEAQASSEKPDRGLSEKSIRISSSMHSRPDMSTPYIEPSSDLEHGIAEIWRDLFHIDQIGIEDDFFELGGHSLLGIQLLAKLRQKFHLDLAPKELFKCASILATIKTMNSSGASAATLQPEQPTAAKISA
jgi:NAD(P)-dependent dehydrogenase (short-subunit alcohol dehydrogenase family)/acyl carrier protein